MVDEPVISPGDELLTMPQVGRELGISRQTAINWALRGRFPAREIAGRTVVRRADIEEFKCRRASSLEAHAAADERHPAHA